MRYRRVTGNAGRSCLQRYPPGGETPRRGVPTVRAPVRPVAEEEKVSAKEGAMTTRLHPWQYAGTSPMRTLEVVMQGVEWQPALVRP